MLNVSYMLSKCDFLGPSIRLNIENKSLYKSAFGGTASLALITLGLMAFFGFGRDFFERINPQVAFNRIIDDTDPLLVITDSNLLFSYYNQDTDLAIPDYERRFTLYYDYVRIYGNGTVIKLLKNPLEKCQNSTLLFWQGYFNVDPSLYYCFPKNSTTELIGVINQGSFSGVRLQLDYCQNNTIKTDCIPKEDTINLLGSGRIQMHYIIQSAQINSFNYSNPGIVAPISDTINTNPSTWTRMNVLFKRVVTNTDTGLFLTQDIATSNFLAVDTINSQSFYTPDTDTIYSHTIGNSQTKEIYNRRYVKLQDIFAMIGGFLNGIILIFRALVEYVAKPQIVDVFNRTYKFLNTDTPQEKEKETNPLNNFSRDNFDKNSVIVSINPTQVSRFSQIIRKPLITAPDVNIIRKKFKNNYSLEMSCITRIFRVCCSKRDNMSRQILIYFRSEAKFMKVMSFEHLMKLTKFVKILKNVILEDYQKEIIRSSPLPLNHKINLTIDNSIKKFEDSLNAKDNKLDEKLYDYIKK